MATEAIYNALNSISPITEEAWYDLQPLFEPIEIKRNEYLVREGSKVNSCYMLIDGAVRVFYNKEGNTTKPFFIPGMFPTPITALLSDSPSLLSFQALLPSKLIQFSYAVIN